MFKRQILAAAFGAFALSVSAPHAIAQAPAPHVKTENIIMLQNDAIIGQRAVSVKDVGLYLKAVREAFDAAYAKIDTPEAVSAVVAIKPGRKGRLWLVSSLPNPPDRTDLMTRFQAIPVPEVKDGSLAFAIRFTIAGAPMAKIPMLPPEWNAAFAGKPAIMPDAITTYIWTD
jgi:hypothetical protein